MLFILYSSFLLLLSAISIQPVIRVGEIYQQRTKELQDPDYIVYRKAFDDKTAIYKNTKLSDVLKQNGISVKDFKPQQELLFLLKYDDEKSALDLVKMDPIGLWKMSMQMKKERDLSLKAIHDMGFDIDIHSQFHKSDLDLFYYAIHHVEKRTNKFGNIVNLMGDLTPEDANLLFKAQEEAQNRAKQLFDELLKYGQQSPIYQKYFKQAKLSNVLNVLEKVYQYKETSLMMNPYLVTDYAIAPNPLSNKGKSFIQINPKLIDRSSIGDTAETILHEMTHHTGTEDICYGKEACLALYGLGDHNADTYRVASQELTACLSEEILVL